MSAKEIWLEAESFSETGGWVTEPQSIPVIHSSYLMAHGMGKPVANAKTGFTATEDGVYHVWALTRDWTAPFGVKDPAGKFTLAIDGRELPETLGTAGAAWNWQKAGTISLDAGQHCIELCDKTGFNGRCDAIYLTDSDTLPPSDTESLDAMRRRLSRGEREDVKDVYDLIVVGGGVAGLCTAIAAARGGVKTLLIHDRRILGGCNSSEVRVCLGGRIKEGEYPNLGDVVREIAPLKGHPALYFAEYYEDNRKRFAAEISGVRMLLDTAVTGIEQEDGRITAVTTLGVTDGREKRIRAKLFADCSGDGILARLSGAAMMYGKEGREDFGETLAPPTADRMTMDHSIRWYSEKRENPYPFPKLDWNLPLSEKNYLNCICGDWEQETGFRRDMVNEIEYIRDYGLRAIYANWSYQKHDAPNKERFAPQEIVWVSPYGGKREGYRVIGDYILSQHDMDAETEYDDGTANVTWGIDIHYPDTLNEREFGEAFRSFAYHRGLPRPCPVPYRCLYARDVENLFLGGRIISTTHVAFSAVRVMRTLGMLGEVVGLAAAICRERDCTPRQVYTEHLDALKESMRRGVPIPSSFACGDIGDIEKYHFKDIGWWYVDSGTTEMPITPEGLEKFRTCVKTMGMEHRHPMPEAWK